jgi:hypothetical protein
MTPCCLLANRSQGVASLADGQLEVMVHRRILGQTFPFIVMTCFLYLTYLWWSYVIYS